MVLPVIITGGVALGGVSSYAMYQGGKQLALPARIAEAPSSTFLSNSLGLASAVGAYSAQNRILNQRFAHLLTYEVPVKVEHWGFRDFLRVTGPYIGTRVAMVSVSVAVLGFVTTKVDVVRSQ
jgi:hypothetical protein